MQTNNRLRGALTKILDLTNSLDEECAVDPVEIRDTAKAALAEPARNCDVGTAEEQLKRFKDFCRIISKDETCDGCPLLPQCSTLKLAQMPYKKGGAK